MSDIKNKLDWVDAIRGYAVLGVLCVHSLMGIDGVLFQYFWGLGAKGVQLFYMASSFTLFYSYYNRKNDEQRITINFFIRRFFRIAPMFYIAIFYYLYQNFGVNYTESDYRHISMLSIIAHFTFLHGFSAYWQDSVVPGGWSVGVEFIFYFLCPFLFLWINNISKAIVLYIFSSYIGFFLNIYFQHHPLIPYTETWKGYLYGFFPSQANIFSLGIFFFWTFSNSFRRLHLHIFILILSLVPLFLANKLLGSSSGMENNIIISFIFLFVFFVLSKCHLCVIVNPFFMYLGKISFSIYLVHFAILHFFETYSVSFLLHNNTLEYFIRLLLVTLTTSIIATLTYKYIEHPMQIFGKKIILKYEKYT